MLLSSFYDLQKAAWQSCRAAKYASGHTAGVPLMHRGLVPMGSGVFQEGAVAPGSLVHIRLGADLIGGMHT